MRPGLLILGAITISLTLSGPASAQVVQPAAVTKSVQVPPGGKRAASLQCPGTAVALHGGPGTNASSRVRVDSTPVGAGPGGWNFRLRSRSGGRVRLVLRCLSLRLPAGVNNVSLVVSRVSRPAERVPAGESRRIEVSCLHGHVATGWGIERDRGSASLELEAAVPSARSWVFRLANPSAHEAAASLAIRCVQPVQRAGSGQVHRLGLRRPTFLDHTDAGRVRHGCHADEFSVATGASLLSQDGSGVSMASTRPLGAGRGQWLFRGGGAATVRTSLVCLDTATGFE
jgi:hypothetical protein